MRVGTNEMSTKITIYNFFAIGTFSIPGILLQQRESSNDFEGIKKIPFKKEY